MNAENKTYDWSSLYEGKEKTLNPPIHLSAEVIHGFKRGSKELGIPTANLNMDELGAQAELLETGIYYGYANLEGKQFLTVVSVGWNPYYKNTRKTIEAHLLANLSDFYGQRLDVTFIGYLRPEANFKSLG